MLWLSLMHLWCILIHDLIYPRKPFWALGTNLVWIVQCTQICTLRSVMSPFATSFLSNIPKPWGMDVLSCNLPPCSHIPLSYIMDLDTKTINQRIQTMRLHASRYHYCHRCNVDFVLFHNIICHINSYYHVSMFILHTSLLSSALWLPYAW
jgi:hypothetical protein